MNDVRIDMNTEEIEFTLLDGRIMEGQVYLSMYSTIRLGSQTIEEFLCQCDRFVPFKTATDFMLLNTSHIVMARIDIDRNKNELARVGEKHRINITTTLGETIEADTYISLPKGYQRVKDHLNQSLKFFACYTDTHILYVNLDFVLSVKD